MNIDFWAGYGLGFLVCAVIAIWTRANEKADARSLVAHYTDLEARIARYDRRALAQKKARANRQPKEIAS